MNMRELPVFSLFISLFGSCEAFLVTSNRPPAIYVQPDFDVFYKSGEPVKLPCLADGIPSPIYRWKRNGLDFDPSGNDGRFSQVPGEGTLIISYSYDRDEGVYRCLAENKFGISSSINVNLRLAKLNDFDPAPPITLRPHLGEPVTLNCDPPLSVPRSDIEWVLFTNEGRLEPIHYNNRITKDFQGRLYITNVQQEDYQNGNAYRCMATNRYMRKNTYDKAIHIIPTGSVSLKRPTKYMWSSPSDILGLRGETLKLKCIFSGNPTPEVFWSKNSNILPHQYNVSLRGQELTITNLTEGDAGPYQCYGTNNNGPLAVRNFVVRVESKPYWNIKPHNIDTSVGASVTFICKAKGYPEPVITWFINGVTLQESRLPILQSNRFLKPDANNITFVNVNNHDQMVLQCNAFNIHGFVFADFYLNIF